MNPLIKEYSSYVPFNPVDYIWIDFASAPIPTQKDADEITKRMKNLGFDLASENKDFPFPFEKMCILLPSVDNLGNKAKNGVLVVTLERNGNAIKFQFWSNTDVKTGSVVINSFGTIEEDCRILVTPAYLKAVKQTLEDAQKHGMEIFRVMLRRVISMCVIGSSNVWVFKCTEDSTRKFINSKRKAKGEKPFFEWTTVTVKPHAPSENKGGTHASPKPHQRRGHVRRKKDGTFVAVKSSFINKHKIPDEGFIFHDYKVAA